MRKWGMTTTPASPADVSRLFELDATDARPVSERSPAGATKTFRPYDRDQTFLMPPCLDDWLPEDHSARFIGEAVDELLDLSEFYASYVRATGAPPYDPRMMLKLVLYGYSTGVTSSREMERRCSEDVAFRWLSGNTAPDYRSFSRFRRRHLAALENVFTQVLALCAQAGLVKLGRVALDGTKLRASASRHKAMSYSHLGPRITQLEAEVKAILADAEATDLAEDEAFGPESRGDEVPAELARRETRLVKMRAAKEAIEQEAKDQAARDQAVEAPATDDEAKAPVTEVEAKPKAVNEAEAEAIPKPKTQRSFTDPDARMMKTNHGFQYAYNAQAVVDEHSQVVLATGLTQCANDFDQLIVMAKAAEANLSDIGIHKRPRVLIADAGYCSQANLHEAGEANLNVLIATGRLKRDERAPSAPRGRIPKDATLRERMARRLRTKAGKADYARRKVIVEPAFGQMKVRQDAGSLRLRGLEGAQGEWILHAICHNLRKLASAPAKAAMGTG